MRAKLPFSAKCPQKDAGIRTEPPPSDPKVIGTMPDAKADAEPLDEPPLVSSAFQGFLVDP